ncbi:MAG: glycerophosphodiester phosphodiesterase family protein [Alkalilacustris sp.]
MPILPSHRGAFIAAAVALALPQATPALAASFNTLTGDAPLVIAHRGASGYLTEHTLAAYELAMIMGADIIEPDLQLTRDGHLIAFHDASLLNDSASGPALTNVADLFEPRNGGFLVQDFDLAEIQQLQTFPRLTASTEFDGFIPSAANAFGIPTFTEVLAFLNDFNAANGTSIGIYPEAKTPNRTQMNQLIVEELAAAGFTSRDDLVYIQSFSYDALRDILDIQAGLSTDMRQVALGGAVQQDGLFGIFEFGANRFYGFDEVSEFADGLGVFIGNFQGQALSAEWVAAAHAANLEVHAWTFRPTTQDASDALTLPFIDWGIDGFFTDFPDLTLETIARAGAAQVGVIPLPAAGWLLLSGLGGLAMLRRRR